MAAKFAGAGVIFLLALLLSASLGKLTAPVAPSTN
jgi:hypothetical protein